MIEKEESNLKVFNFDKVVINNAERYDKRATESKKTNQTEIEI
jgi:hypothetical protein